MRILKFLCGALAVFTLGFNAQAILIEADDAKYSGTQPINPKEYDIEIITVCAPLSLLYKTGGEEGPYKDSYETSFGAGDETASIVYDGGGPAIAPQADCLWLLVKDGAAHDPVWYLFDLSAAGLNWNGTDTLDVAQLWPAQGSISHVDIFGLASSASVPDGGSTLILLGSVLVGFGALRRRFAT